MATLSVIGAGGWGTTLAVHLAGLGHDVLLWTEQERYADEIRDFRENKTFLPGITVPESVTVTTDLDRAIDGIPVIVSAIPSQFTRGVFETYSRPFPKETIIVNVSKGIEKDTLKTMSSVLIDCFPGITDGQIVTLSGPSHAEEVSRGVPTAVVAASRDIQSAKTVQALFSSPVFRVYRHDDILGVELGGALKNVIAIAAGVSDGAGFGDNTKAAIMTRGIAEIVRLGTALGANPMTFSGLSGLGDLIVTCMSRHSRNRYVGEEVGKGRPLPDVLSSMKMVAEGVETTKSAIALSERHGVELPIAIEVSNVLFLGRDSHLATNNLMTRELRTES